MKKTVFISILLSILFSVTYADTIKKTYYFNQPNITKIKDYHTVDFMNTMQIGKNGSPMLPYAAIKLLLPPGHEAVSISFVKENKQTINEKINLYPKQPAQPYSKPEKNVFTKNEAVYATSTTYPEKAYNSYSTHFLHGHAIMLSAFTPIEYIPSKQALTFYQKVTVIVETKPSAKAEKALQLLPSTRKEKEIKDYVQNPNNTSLYSYKNAKSFGYDYLMITTSEYATDLDTLVSFYADRGFKSKIVTLDEINSEMEGVDTPEKMRNYIIQEYQNYQIEYVLLGGDADVVPYRGFYCQVQSSSIYEDDGIPADVYFSGLDGSWNDDGDDKWAEPEEDDLLLEVSVSRMPFSNHSELESILHKTLTYQSQPILGEQKKEFFAGEFLYEDPETWGSQYLELHIGFHDDNGYETQGFTEDYDIQKLYAVEVGEWSSGTLMSIVNTGKNLLYHTGHANENTVMHLFTYEVTNENFSGANGTDHTYTNVYTHGCICGSFDASDCIGETMVKIDNFAASFIGNSRYGWFNEGQTEGPSQHIHREFTDELIRNKNIHIANAHKASKTDTAPWVEADGQHEEGALRWCFYDCNVLGEPAMMLWTDNPIDYSVNYPNAFQLGVPSINVDVHVNNQPIENSRVVLKQGNTILGIGITDENGQATIEIDTNSEVIGDAKLYVSGNNMLLQTFDTSIIPNEGSYLTLADYDIENENPYNHVFNGETVDMSVIVENCGVLGVTDVQTKLDVLINCCATLNDDTEEIASIDGEATVELNNAYNITIDEIIEDQTEIPLIIQFEAGDKNWESIFTVKVDAPKLEIGGMTINDEDGNNNGIIDSGETFEITIQNLNIGHNSIEGLTGELTVNSSDISISEAQHLDGLNPGETKQTIYTVTTSETLEEGSIIEFTYHLTSDNGYAKDKTFIQSVGLITDDFETGDFSLIAWDLSHPNPWIITNNNPFEGDYSASSKQIENNQESILRISVNVLRDDTISFMRKVSSEEDFDIYTFSIDDVEKEYCSGNKDWARVSFPVSSGEHVFKWTYRKDISTSSGEDKAYIDMVKFPPSLFPISTTDIVTNSSNLRFYPNPARNILNIDGISDDIDSFEIYNVQGILVKTILNTDKQLVVNVNDLEKGLYMIVVNQKEKQEQHKIIIF